MTAIGTWGASIVVLAGTALLTFGLGAMLLVEKQQVKVHALALGAVGPVLILVAAPVWADGRIILTALLLSAFLLLTSAISTHAIMTYLDAPRRWRAREPSDPSEGARAPDGD